MKTSNRPTASKKPTAHEIEALSRSALALWATPPKCPASERAEHIVELTELDLDIERLAVRAACDSLQASDALHAHECATRLSQLERRWRGDTDRQPSLTLT